MEKSADAFRTISEVADDLTLPQHVLRFWETRFPQIRPLKRAGGRRYYRPADVVLLKTIRQLLYDDGYTIKGVQRLLKEQGPRALATPASVDLDFAGEESAAGKENVARDEDIAGDEDMADTDEPASEDVAPQPRLDTVDADLHAFQRDGLIEAMATIDECLAILAAARQSA